MSALWIAHVTITDEDAYSKYASLATQAIAQHNGQFLARGGRYIQLEGKERSRHVVVKFPSVERAQQCYQSDIYQRALSYARNASEREMMIVQISD